MATSDLYNRMSRRVASVPPSPIRRFFEIAATMDNVISLGIGEPDFVSPQPVIDAAVASLNEGLTGYTANRGIRALLEAISARMDHLHGVAYDPLEQIIVTVGVSEALQLSLMALLDEGDEVLIPEPCFVSYGPSTSFCGGVPVFVPTRVENKFRVTAEDLERCITPRTKVVLLQYPNNPTGAVMDHEGMQEIAAVINKHDLFVISDEIYGDLIYGEAFDSGHVCVPAFTGLKERTILVGGFSKTYAMTGWRVGYACGPKPLIDAIFKLHQYVIMSAPTMGQVGAIAALGKCDDHVEEMRREYDERRSLIVDGLRAIGLPTFEPEGAFYCFPDVRPTGLTDEVFADRLLQEQSVACVPGSAFGPSGKGFVRCSYAASKENISSALERMDAFVTQL